MVAASSPVSRSVFRNASTIDPRHGCDVRPDSASIAASTASTPASTAAKMVEAAMPEVSCVWKWIGRPTSSFSALTRILAACRLQQACHVLDAKDMGAGSFQFLRQIDVVFQIIFRTRTVEHVAGVAEHALAEFSGFLDRIHGNAHVLNPVQAVKDAEEIHAVFGRLVDEELDHIVRIVGVANPVGAPQQHLKQDVRRPFADLMQPLPGAFRQEAHGNVERRAAPAFQGKQRRQTGCVSICDVDDVMGAHAGRQQGLVAIAHRRVGEQRPFFRLHPLGEAFRTELIQELARSLRFFVAEIWHDRRSRILRRPDGPWFPDARSPRHRRYRSAAWLPGPGVLSVRNSAGVSSMKRVV
jgi:hypothetical protein